MCTVGGKERWLCYTADAYFDICDSIGEDAMIVLGKTDRAAYDAAVRCLVILAREGELVRRYMGYDAQEMLTEDEVRRVILPNDVPDLKRAVCDAIFAGLRIEKETKEEEPVDVGLAEYEKKTGIAVKR